MASTRTLRARLEPRARGLGHGRLEHQRVELLQGEERHARGHRGADLVGRVDDGAGEGRLEVVPAAGGAGLRELRLGGQQLRLGLLRGGGGGACSARR